MMWGTCKDCCRTDMEMFVLKNDLWLSIAEKQDILCFDCAERRMNRKITFDDLQTCGLTDEYLLGIKIWNQTPEHLRPNI